MWNKPDTLNTLSDLLMLAGMAALIAASLVWLMRLPNLPIRQVVVPEALGHVKRNEIEQVLAGTLQGNFFRVNPETVRLAVERLPWVRQASVRRKWPAALELRIEEHRAVARWEEAPEAARSELVNSFGEVFVARMDEQAASALPQMFGPAGTAPEVLRRFAEFSGILAPTGQKPVQLTLSPRLAWRLRLADGTLVELGREQQKAPVSQRLQRFVEIYPTAVGNRPQKPVAVDLRYPNGFAMRSKG